MVFIHYQRFNVFSKKDLRRFFKIWEGIATNILASRLQSLEDSNIIEKLDHPDSKAKILYRLTQKGIDLLPILVEMYLWADKYFTVPDDIKAIIEAGKKDKEGFTKSILEALKVK